MSEVILIELIKTNRTTDHVAQLADHIQARGLLVPILVDQDYNLVDGLRRLEAMKLLGETKIPAVVATTYEEAIANLKLAHLGRDGGVGPRRTWEISVGIDELMQGRTKRLRAKYATVPIKNRGTVAKEPRSREMLCDALNDPNAAKYGQVYRAAELGSEFAQSLIEAMESGEIMASTAVSRIGDMKRHSGDVRTPGDQRALLRSATRGLSGLVKGLDKLSYPINLPKGELVGFIKELRIHRAKLTSFLRYIEKESNQL